MGLWNLIKLALIAFLVWTLYKALRNWLGKNTETRRAKSNDVSGVIDVMVQDPQCGTYLPQHEALGVRIKGRDVFFCSEECKKAYLNDLNKKQQG